MTLALLGALLIPAGAQADARARARLLFQQGNELRARSDHAGALEKFRQAYRLLPSYKIDLNMGLTLLDLGRDQEAAAVLERFLRRGAHRSPGYIVTLAHRRLERLRRRLASVRVQCQVAGATVVVDSRVRGRTPLHEAAYFKVSGARSVNVLVRRRGYAPFSRKVVLGQGQHLDLEVVLRPARVPGTRVQMDLKRSLAPTVPGADEQLELDDSLGPWPTKAVMEIDFGDAADPMLAAQRRRKTVWGYTLLGTGLACAVTAGVLYGVSISSGNEAHEQYRASTADTDQATIDLHRQDVEAARAKVAAGNVLLGAAAVAVGISVYLLLTRPDVAAEQPGIGAVGVALTPVRGGAAFILGGRF